MMAAALIFCAGVISFFFAVAAEGDTGDTEGEGGEPSFVSPPLEGEGVDMVAPQNNKYSYLRKYRRPWLTRNGECG
jgi:hypothetical protein